MGFKKLVNTIIFSKSTKVEHYFRIFFARQSISRVLSLKMLFL